MPADDDGDCRRGHNRNRAKRSVPIGRKDLPAARNAGVTKKIVDNDLSDETEALIPALPRPKEPTELSRGVAPLGIRLLRPEHEASLILIFAKLSPRPAAIVP